MNKNPFNKDIMKLLWEKSNMKNIYEENRKVLLKESGKYDSNKWFYSEDRKKLSSEDKVVEDVIEIVKEVIKRKNYKNIQYVSLFIEDYPEPFYLVTNNNKIKKLNLSNFSDECYQTEFDEYSFRHGEIAFTLLGCDLEYIKKEIIIKSLELFFNISNEEAIKKYETLDIIYPKEINEGIHTDKHEALSDEDKVVENLFELSKFCLKKLKIKFKEVNYIESHFEGGNMGPHYALLHSNEKIKLDFYEHCDRDSDNKERLHENEAFPTKEEVKEDPSLLEVYNEDEIINEDRVNEKVKEKSKKYFSKYRK